MKSLLIIIVLLFTLDSFAALDKTACATLVVTKIKARNPETDVSNIQPYWEDICEALIVHITTSAVINTTGVTTVSGGSSAGPHPSASTGTIQ